MSSLEVVVLEELLDRSSEMPLAEDDHAVQAFGLDRQHKSFRVRVGEHRQVHSMVPNGRNALR